MENPHPDDVLRNLAIKAKDKAKWRKVNHARYTMHFISGLLILSSAVMWYTIYSVESSLELDLNDGTKWVIYFMLAVAGGYIGLSIWAKTQPKLAITIAIVIFLIPPIIEAVDNPSSIFNGLWWKLLILGLFVRGLLSVKYITLKDHDDDLLDDFEI